MNTEYFLKQEKRDDNMIVEKRGETDISQKWLMKAGHNQILDISY